MYTAEKAYRLILEDIINGKYMPGDFLLELDIASRLKMSRTPVNSALSRLESEGYLTRMPKKGCCIPTPTPKEVNLTFSTRSFIEAESAASAAVNIEDDEIDILDGIINKERSIFSIKDSKCWADINMEFHFSIAKFSHNPYLERWVKQIYWHCYLYISYLNGFYLPNDLNEKELVTTYKTPEYHAEIAKAIKSRQPKEARKLMEEHILHTYSFHFKK